MKLSLLTEDNYKKNVLILVHPNYFADLIPNQPDTQYLYFHKIVNLISKRLAEGWIVVVSYMPLWGETEAIIDKSQPQHKTSSDHASQHEVYKEFINNLNKFKANRNFLFVVDSPTKQLCNDEKVMDVILNKAIQIEIGGGYESSCLKKTIENLQGIVPIKPLYNIIFDYRKY